MFSKINYVSDLTVSENIRKQLDGKNIDKRFRNNLPKGWKEMTLAEFSCHPFFIWGADYMRYNQSAIEPNKPVQGIYEFWRNDGSGFALVSDQKTVRFFRIGCAHNWQEHSVASMKKHYPEHVAKMTIGNCCHNEVCKDCGVFRFIDSSD